MTSLVCDRAAARPWSAIEASTLYGDAFAARRGETVRAVVRLPSRLSVVRGGDSARLRHCVTAT
jgi:hypothetical protein